VSLPATHPRAHRQLGFSLIELMVVIVIIGMMTSVAVISWRVLLPNQQMNTAIRNLSEALHDTRSKAIAYNREFEIHYQIDEDRYWVVTPYRRFDGGFAVSEDEERLFSHETDLFDSGIDILEIIIDDKEYRDGEVYVRFDPLGAASNHTILLEQTMFERSFTVEVLPLTGEIRFHDGIWEREIAEERDFD
jgi:prepilin-type N-terminal cleavage/methylation domain-containing protein